LGKVVDITSKLSFEDHPKILIKNQEIEINDDAPTMLQIMNLMQGDEVGVAEIAKTLDLLFSPEARNRLDALKLSMSDLIVVVKEVIGIVTGDVVRGEQ
jgi:hypothetical protein